MTFTPITEKFSYEHCQLCARRCGVNRTRGEIGFCASDATARIAYTGLHMWEEPIISGERGSGAIFFGGCSLGCIYCQNYKISRAATGRQMSEGEIAEIMLDLEGQGAHNINFVTPTHYAPSVSESVKIARKKGLLIPIVYNTGSYDTRKTLISLENTVDIYLPDFKYYREKTAKELSCAAGYVKVAKEAIAEMVRQRPAPVIEQGIMKSGVIVRVLLLPSHLAEAKLAVRYLFDTYGDSIYISLMSQYTPRPDLPSPLNRRVSAEEYGQLLDYAERIGVVNGFTQERSSASESFIPLF